MKRILLPHTRELCYFSGGFFLSRLQDALEARGAEVRRLSLSGGSSAGLSDGASFSALEDCLSEPFNAVFDINSKLPYLCLEDGAPYLDRLGVPFFNYVLDHPLYHHPGLSFVLKDYRAVAIDESHAAYMRAQYPHLKDVFYHPVPGTKAVFSRPFSERRISFLFSGTYLSNDVIEAELHAQGEAMYALLSRVIEVWEPKKMPMEEAVKGLYAAESALFRRAGAEISGTGPFGATISDAAESGQSDTGISFAEWMNRLYPADRYLRNEKRRRILTALAKSGIELTVIGEGWEETALPSYENVTLLPPMPIAQTTELIADSRVVLDVNPLFYRGCHDRVTTALANGCLAVTDMNPAAAPELHDGESVLYYDCEKPEEIPERLTALTEAQKEDIAAAGQRVYEETYTWDRLAERILSISSA